MPGNDENDVCQNAYVKVTGDIGSKLLIRKEDGTRYKYDLGLQWRHKLDKHICRQIDFEVGTLHKKHKVRHRGREQFPSTGDFEYENKTSEIDPRIEELDFQVWFEQRRKLLTDFELKVFKMKKIEGYKFEEIATRLNRSLDEVKQAYADANEKLFGE
jgi:hypothetical protein